MTDRTKILTSPFFFLGLGLLLINDFYFKSEFSNWLTGKLSDVSGLFIFPLFLTVIFPRFKRTCFHATALLFILWKTPISTPLIETIQNAGIPIGRTVDYSDLITLLILPLAFMYERSNYVVWKVKPHVLLPVAALSFVATTIPPQEKKQYSHINKSYQFSFSRQILVDRLNHLTAEKLSKQPRDSEIVYNAEGDLLYCDWTGDTLSVFIDSQKLSNSDTIHYRTVLADFLVLGNDSVSSLEFITAYKVVSVFSDKDYREKAIKEFEKRVIRKLKD